MNLNYILRKIYDLDDCTECQEARTTTRYESLNQVNIQDDDEEVFEKEDFEDYDQSHDTCSCLHQMSVSSEFIMSHPSCNKSHCHQRNWQQLIN